MRLAVFASGRGSNFQALLQAAEAGELPRAEFVALVSDKPHARALELAAEKGIAAIHVNPKDHPDRENYERAILAELELLAVEAVCLAGYMRLVGQVLLERFPQRILNIHPALLPSFPGLHGQRDALDYGVKVTGCTVHFVDAGVDTGPIIVQRTVPVLDGDDEAALAARILREEHRAYPEALRLLTEGRLKVQGRRVRVVD